MEVERLQAVLEVSGLAGMQANLAAADRAVGSTRDKIASLDASSRVAADALNKIRLTAQQAAETGASAEFFKAALKKIGDQAEVAATQVGYVKLTAAQAVESKAAGDVIAGSLGDISSSADEAMRKIAELEAAILALKTANSGRGGGGGASGGGVAGALGWGGGRFGMASFGSALSLAGFGAEHAITSSVGILGSLGGGLLGGGLLGLGALGTGAVGMGTDLAGIGQAAGDIKTVYTGLSQLNDAIDLYGRNSTQAAQAQAQLDQQLGDFSPVAKAAVLQAAQVAQQFRTVFDQATGQAEKTGAEIITQAMQVGEKFLPTVGTYAAQNMGIIQQGLQPLFQWLDNPGKTGGLGIFRNLEEVFQGQLPTSVHALTQGVELFSKTVDVAAQYTGGFVSSLDRLLTKWNTPTAFAAWSGEIGKLIGLFHSWLSLFGALAGAIFDVFKPAVGFGQQFAQMLTGIIDQVRQWLNLTSTQSALNGLFNAHLQEVVQGIGQVLMALLPMVEGVATQFMRISTIASTMAGGALQQLAQILNEIMKIPFAPQIIGWVGALAIVKSALGGVLTALSLMPAAASKASAETSTQLAAIGTEAEVTASKVDMVKASLTKIGGTVVTAVIALSLVPKNTTGQQVLNQLGLGGLGKLPILGGAATQIANGENALANYFGRGVNTNVLPAPGFDVNLGNADTGLGTLPAGAVNLGNADTTKAGAAAIAAAQARRTANMSAGKQKLLEFAKAALGTPYLWGGNGPGGFDCSGLVQWAFANGLNVQLPRTTYGQVTVGAQVASGTAGTTTSGRLGVGDILFTNYGENGRSGPGHEGMVVGYDRNGQPIIESAPHTGSVVQRTSLAGFTNSYWTARNPLAKAPPATPGTPGVPQPGTGTGGVHIATGLTTAQQAALTLHQTIQQLRTQVAGLGTEIGSDRKTGLLSPDIATGLQKQVAKINDTLKGAGKNALPGIRVNIATLKTQLAEGLAQAADDQKLKTTIATLNSNIANSVLPKSLGDRLLTNAKNMSFQLADGLMSPEARRKVETNMASLTSRVSEWVAQFSDDAKLKTSMQTISQDLADGLLSKKDADQLLARARVYNSQLTDTLLNADTRRKVEANIAALTQKLTVDLNLEKDRQTLASDLTQLNQSVATGVFPPTLLALAKAQAAAVGKAIAQGTAAGNTAAGNELKKLATTISEGVADATAIQNFQQSINTFDTGLLSKLKSVLGQPDTYATPQALAAAETGAEKILQKLSDGLTGNALTAAKTALSDYQKTIESGLNGLEAAVETAKTPFEAAWTSLGQAADQAFSQQTSQTVTKMQTDLQTAVANMQVLVTTAYGQFMYGGPNPQTPAGAQLAAMQAADTQTQLQQQLTAAQTAVAAAQGAATVYNAATGTTTVNANNAALITAQQQLAAAQNAIVENQLQQQATVEQTAAQAQLTAAQTAYTNQQNTAIQAYQNQRSLVQTAMDQQVQAVETAFEQNKITASAAFNQLQTIYKNAGINLAGLSVAIGGVIYNGVSAWSTPLTDLMDNLQAAINALVAAVQAAQNALAGAGSGGGGGGGGGGSAGGAGTAPGAYNTSAAYQAATAAIAQATQNLYVKGAVPQFRTGGPTGPGGLSMLHPDEYVVPKEGALVATPASRGRSGNGDVHIHINGPVYGADADELVRQLVAAFTRHQRSGGAVPWQKAS